MRATGCRASLCAVGWWQVEGGADKMVTLDNIGEFVSLATRAMLHDTVAEQVCVCACVC